MNLQFLETPVPGPERRDAWVALFFTALMVGFILISWQKWPLVTADSARELYVPFQIRHGALIYRDFAYLYGPVAPYLQAGLLSLFGDRLEVLYVASLTQLVAIMTLLYTLSRQVLPPWPSAAVLWIFWSHFALGRDIWGYVWPYSFAATFGVLWGLGILLALARHAATQRRGWLVLAGVAVGLSLVTKLEFGFAAAGIALFYGGLRAWARPGLWNWCAEALALVGPMLCVAGVIVANVLGRVSLADVISSVWPVQLMKLWGSQGAWHGSVTSWLWNVKWLLLDVATVVAILTHERWLRHRASALILVIGAAAGALTLGSFYLLNGHLYWMSPGFLVLMALLAVTIWHGRSQPLTTPATVWALIGAYGLLVASRTLMLGYNDYLRYQAPVALIAWVGLVSGALPRVLDITGKARERAMLGLVTLVVLLGGQHVFREGQRYLGPHEAVSGPMGTVLVEPAFARPFNAALAFIAQHRRPGETIVAAPMEASFYLFSGIDNVLHEDQLFWGYLTTADEQSQALRRMQERHVRFVLVSTYAMGQHHFGEDFMPDLGRFLQDRCQLVANFAEPGYGVKIYETPFGQGI